MFGFFKKKAQPVAKADYPFIKITENGLGNFRFKLCASEGFSCYMPTPDNIGNMKQAEIFAEKFLENRRRESQIVNTSIVY